MGDSGFFRALSSQLDLVGLHLLGSMVLDGLEGGVVSPWVVVCTELSPWPILIPIRVCVLEAGREGFIKPSSLVDVVVELLMEFEVPGRS